MVNLPRRTGLGALLALLAGGCAAPDEAAPVKRPAPTALLTPWLSLAGGWAITPEPGALPMPTLPPGFPRAPIGGRLNFQLPIALAARDDVVWVVDAGLRQLLRLERSRDSVAVVAAVAADMASSLLALPDGTAWLAEPASGQVRQFDRNGRVLRIFRDDRFAARPVAVAWMPEAGGDVFVADAQLSHIAVFDTFGRVIRRFGQGRLQSVAGLAIGPAGLYVVDRLAQQVHVFGRDGQWLSAMGDDSLVMPRAIAVDAGGRVYVGDEADGAIQVFIDGERVARFAGAGALRLGRIDALAADGNLLYVADGLSARVQILLITPESLRRPAP